MILFIGDGMGPNQVLLLNNFLEYTRKGRSLNQASAFKRILKKGAYGISQTKAHGHYSVDSACSATQLASGEESLPEMVGLNYKGKKIKSILMKAKERGMATGLVSDTRISHATPAAFASHSLKRTDENEIVKQMVSVGPDVLLSGGAKHFVSKFSNTISKIPFKVKPARNDAKDIFVEAQKRNYQLLFDKESFSTLNYSKKVLGIFSNSGMPDAIWQSNNKNNKERSVPNLKEMTVLALDKLSRNSNGFFLMVEGGQIDWAGHRNDGGTLLHEMLSFNETLNYLLDWQKQNPDTLLVVTADHETGSFSMGYNTNEIPQPVEMKNAHFSPKPYQAHMDYAKHSVLDSLYDQKHSLAKMWKKYVKAGEKGAFSLGKIIYKNTGKRLSNKALARILANENNNNFIKWHKTLNSKKLPSFGDKREYYYDNFNARLALMGRALAPKYNLIWGTGGHTASSVEVYSVGPRESAKAFRGMHTHTDLGKLLQESMGL